MKTRNCKDCGADISHRGASAVRCAACSKTRKHRAEARKRRSPYKDNGLRADEVLQL